MRHHQLVVLGGRGTTRPLQLSSDGRKSQPLTYAQSSNGLRYARRVTRRFRYLDLMTIGFIVVLLISNLVGPKICRLGPLRPSAAEFLFPVTYICGDVFTEVYGYGASRRAIWMGFFAMALLAATGQFAVWLPPAPEWHGQGAFATVFSLVPRFAAASLIAYWAGEFTNSYTLAKLKLITGGRWLWTRTVGSTVTGQAVDTAVVVAIAFGGTLSPLMLLRIMGSSYLIKVAVEVVATPVTYLVVGWLKRVEGVDAYDSQTNFNPFTLRSEKA
jgi:queuosine precursor transporter